MEFPINRPVLQRHHPKFLKVFTSKDHLGPTRSQGSCTSGAFTKSATFFRAPSKASVERMDKVCMPRWTLPDTKKDQDEGLAVHVLFPTLPPGRTSVSIHWTRGSVQKSCEDQGCTNGRVGQSGMGWPKQFATISHFSLLFPLPSKNLLKKKCQSMSKSSYPTFHNMSNSICLKKKKRKTHRFRTEASCCCRCHKSGSTPPGPAVAFGRWLHCPGRPSGCPASPAEGFRNPEIPWKTEPVKHI